MSSVSHGALLLLVFPVHGISGLEEEAMGQPGREPTPGTDYTGTLISEL